MVSSLMSILMLLSGVFWLSSYAAKCSSNEYCPKGWTVKRNPADLSAITCDAMSPHKKCEKPHTCVASRCGISFCCVNDEMFMKMKERQEMEAENAEADDDEKDAEL